MFGTVNEKKPFVFFYSASSFGPFPQSRIRGVIKAKVKRGLPGFWPDRNDYSTAKKSYHLCLGLFKA